MNPVLPSAPRPRQSNIELLRIVAMFFVLMLHANCLVLGYPEVTDFQTNWLPAATQTLFEQTAICAVNLFVLISGWFGIHTKRKSLTALIFQYVFLAGVLLLVPGVLCSDSLAALKTPVRALISIGSFWFVPAYLMLCLLAPALNAMVEHSSRRVLRHTLIAFFAFQTIYSWGFAGGAGSMFSNGYSTLSFVGLYLLARYVRVYRPWPFVLRARVQYLVALAFILIPAFISSSTPVFMGGGNSPDVA